MLRLATLITAAVLVSLAMAAADLSGHIPPASPRLDGYCDVDSIRARIDSRGVCDPVEGLWQLASSQAVVLIEPATHPALSGAGFRALQMVVVSSPRKSTRPGTVMGYLVPAARDGVYDAEIYTTLSRGLLSRHARHRLDLADRRHLTVTPAKSRLRVGLRHTFNFLIRSWVSVSNHDGGGTASAPDGFIRLYPLTDGKPLTPVYL